MGQNEVGYLKGVLTRSGTYSGKTDREEWKIQNLIGYSILQHYSVMCAQNGRSSFSFHEMHRLEESEVVCVTLFYFKY